MKAIVVEQTGGPGVMRLLEGEDPGPRPGQISVKVAAAGVNFIDVYHRTGAYGLPLPFTPGLEGGGYVAAVGAGVTDFAVGDEVAWKSVPGSYADLVVGDAAEFVPVPEKVAVETAAAVMLQGLTAHYLCNTVYDVQEGDTVIVHAAAGGMGLLLTQMVKYKGGKVIGTVSTDAKAELARQNGADHVHALRGVRREGPRAHRRRRRCGRLRRRRQDHLQRRPRLAAPPRRDGPLRPGQRPRAARRPAGHSTRAGRSSSPARPSTTSPPPARSTCGARARSSR